MSNAKTTKRSADKSPAEQKIEQLVCAADVARDVATALSVSLDPKRARAHLRKHVPAYQTIKRTTFARDSKPYKTLFDALSTFAAKMKSAPTA